MSTRYPVIAFAAFALAALAAVSPGAARAQETIVAEVSVTVPANGQASIPIKAFCLEQGQPFPESVAPPRGLAPEAVRKVLIAALDQGIAQTDPLQTNLAIWRQIEGRWSPEDSPVDRSVAEALFASANATAVEPLVGDGISLEAAIADGSITASVQGWSDANGPRASETDLPYYGSGNIVLANNTAAPIEVYYPIGMVLPAADPEQQDMVSYAAENRTVQPKTLPKTGAIDFLPALAVLAGLAAVIGGTLRRLSNEVEA